MEKTVADFDARSSLGRILEDVAVSGDRVVVERYGEPIAAVVPIEVYNQWKRSRAEFFARMRRAAEQANLPPEEADELASEAVKAVRANPEAAAPSV